MVISSLSGLFSGQSAYPRSRGTCYLGGDGREQAVAFSHFISIVVSSVFGLPEENVNCVAMMETAWKLLRDPNENHLNDSATPVLGNEVSILTGLS